MVEGISLAVVSIVTVTGMVSSIGDISAWVISSTSTEVISSVEGLSSGRAMAISSFEVPGAQGVGRLTSTGALPVDGLKGVELSIFTPEGDPLGGGIAIIGC